MLKVKMSNLIIMQTVHYKNMPIQVYWKVYHQKMKIFW